MNAPQVEEPVPTRLKRRPRDHRGFIVPYFVAWMKDGVEVNPPHGAPDFRVVSANRMARCKRYRRCWVCGEPMGRNLVFTIGPMCAITRTTMEPPSHYECALYSVKVCPFLSRPMMKRHEKDMPEGHWAPGAPILRNPGVSALWVTPSYTKFKPNGGGELLTVGDPERVEWWAKGRPATRAEVLASVESGLPALYNEADREGPVARAELEFNYVPKFERLLPPA